MNLNISLIKEFLRHILEIIVIENLP